MDPLTIINQLAPDFELLDLQGRPHRLSERGGAITILNFWSADCPWSERTDRLMAGWLEGWGRSIAIWRIAANGNEPPEMLVRVAAERSLDVVLHDPYAKVADLYAAQTTPHVFVIDTQGILRYQGAVDDVTFRQRTPTRYYLQEAVEALLAGRLPEPAEAPPYGCALLRGFFPPQDTG